MANPVTAQSIIPQPVAAETVVAASVGESPESFDTFDPTNIGTNIILDEGDRSFSRAPGSGYTSVISMGSHTQGDGIRVVEVSNASSTPLDLVIVGIADTLAPESNFPGNYGVDSAGIHNINATFTRWYRTSGGFINKTGVDTDFVGSTTQYIFDFDALTVSIVGASTVTESFAVLGLDPSVDYFIVHSIFDDGVQVNYNFGQLPAIYPMPVGGSWW